MRGLDNVVSYIEKNLEGSIRVPQLAEIARLSTAHFSRAFTKALGVTPARYIRLRRIQAAMIMMRTTTETLSMIAISSGHSDQSHFTRVFSRFVGVSPNRWRKRAWQTSASIDEFLTLAGVGAKSQSPTRSAKLVRNTDVSSHPP
jgi:transcriptional regulator GlxA family with amidase domain